MRPALIVLLSLIVVCAVMARAEARLQPVFLCWEPDSEFPVACDEENDD